MKSLHAVAIFVAWMAAYNATVTEGYGETDQSSLDLRNVCE